MSMNKIRENKVISLLLHQIQAERTESVKIDLFSLFPSNSSKMKKICTLLVEHLRNLNVDFDLYQVLFLPRWHCLVDLRGTVC